MQKGKKVTKRILVIFLAFFLFLATVVGVGFLGVWISDASWTHWRPDYEKTDISSLVTKATLSQEEYDLIYRQTGLTKVAVDDCRAKERTNRILEVQTAFFKKSQVYKTCFAPFTYIETINDSIPLALLEDGDILLSASMRCSFFRYGHSALVVDGQYGKILESQDFSTVSALGSATSFANLSSFLVLRPKADKQIKDRVAAFAVRELTGIRYSLTAGIFGAKYQENPRSTQCAHLVWTAYMRYGVDLDANGGLIVPQDFLSDKVEVVQAYGFDLDTLWR